MSKVTYGDRSTAPKAIEDCHSLLGWMLPQLDKFPRSRRFTLGSRIEDGLLFVLEKLVEAACSVSVVGGPRTEDRGQRTVVGSRWSVVGGRWSVVGGRWSVVGGRWSVVGGRWSVVGGR